MVKVCNIADEARYLTIREAKISEEHHVFIMTDDVFSLYGHHVFIMTENVFSLYGHHVTS